MSINVGPGRCAASPIIPLVLQRLRFHIRTQKRRHRWKTRRADPQTNNQGQSKLPGTHTDQQSPDEEDELIITMETDEDARRAQSSSRLRGNACEVIAIYRPSAGSKVVIFHHFLGNNATRAVVHQQRCRSARLQCLRLGFLFIFYFISNCPSVRGQVRFPAGALPAVSKATRYTSHK